MATVSWTQTTSGSWATPGAWLNNNGVNGDPLRDDTVQIEQSTSITVTYGAGSVVLDSLTTGASDAFDMAGGTLATLYGVDFGGALTMSGGTLLLGGGASFGSNVTLSAGTIDLRNGGSAGAGIFNMTGGSIAVDGGTFYDADFGTLSGTISGAALVFDNGSSGGSTALAGGFVASTNSITVTNTTLFLNEGMSYAGVFSLSSNGIFNLNGNTVTLSGVSSLDGDVRGGVLKLSGTGHLYGMQLDNGADASMTGVYEETGSIALGSPDGTGTLSISNTGTLRIVGNSDIYLGSGGGTLINSGLLEKTGGSSFSGTTIIYTDIDNMSTGTINAGFGTIDFAGPSSGAVGTLSGTLESMTPNSAGTPVQTYGTIEFTAGSYLLQNETLTVAQTVFANSASVTLASNSALTYGGDWDQLGGLILVENALTLSGLTALDGGEMKGTATVTIDGSMLHLGNQMDLEGNLTFDLNYGATATSTSLTVNQTGVINIGALSDSVDQVNVGATTSWYLEGTTGIAGAFGTITNAGLFDKISGPGISSVSSVIDNTGTLEVSAGTLALSGQGTLGGTVDGSAVLDISGGFTLASGLVLTVGTLILDAGAQNDVQATLAGNLKYAQDFAMEGGTLALSNTVANTTVAHTLTLSGVTSLGSGTILGGGSVLVTGAATVGALGTLALAQGADLLFTAATQQLSDIVMTGGATAPDLTIGAASTYTMDYGLYIGGPSNSTVGTVTVLGKLQMNGSDTINATINDRGNINITQGQMTFLGPLTGNGTLTISAGGVLDLENSAKTVTAITFGTGSGDLYLQQPADYAGVIGGFATGDQIELGGLTSIGGTFAVSASGSIVTITSGTGATDTLHFSSAQSAGSLTIGAGANGWLELIHT